ncbi:MAG: hypothetical protein H6729_05600 [Deltaproteobacteria bacterium]|nr:hypothetical protein [Deltaproteobacteria bacterium]
MNMIIRAPDFRREARPGTAEELSRRGEREGVSITEEELRSLSAADLDGNGVIGDSSREVEALWHGLDRYDTDARRDRVQGRAYDLARVIAPGADPLRDLRASPESMRTIAGTDRALARATELERSGRGDAARELLRTTGDSLLERGERFEAARVFRRLQEAPNRDQPVNLLDREMDAYRRDHPGATDVPRILSTESGGTYTHMDTRDFATTYGDLASRRLAQIEQHDRMERVLGRSMDPRSPDDARDYFTAFSRGRSTDAVRTEYEQYLQNFYVHAGNNVSWTTDIPADRRHASLDTILARQPQDGAGRTIIDCEGYADITRHVLSGARTSTGEQRFTTGYASRPTHIISAVGDRETGEAFVVNNASTRRLEGTSAERGLSLLQEIGDVGEDQTTLVGVGDSVTDARPIDEATGRPRLGSIIWHDGPRGVVGLDFLDRFDTAERNHQIPPGTRAQRLEWFIRQEMEAGRL